MAEQYAAPAGAIERRVQPRYAMDRAVVALAVQPDGTPDLNRQYRGTALDVSRGGLQVKLDGAGDVREGTALAVGVAQPEGGLAYEGLLVRHTRSNNGTCAVGGAFDGRVHHLLAQSSRLPELRGAAMAYDFAVPQDVLDRWADAGVLRRVLLDTVSVCPKCGALPTFRAGCRSCGSGRIMAEKMIHHFACAHVDTIARFETSASGAPSSSLVCPKCRTKNLIVGSDFEYLSVSRCLDCQWSGSDPQLVAHCLRCSHRYPADQSATRELVGYDAQRFDPLAVVPAPQ